MGSARWSWKILHTESERKLHFEPRRVLSLGNLCSKTQKCTSILEKSSSLFKQKYQEWEVHFDLQNISHWIRKKITFWTKKSILLTGARCKIRNADLHFDLGGGPGSENLGARFWDNKWPKRTPTWANFLVGFWSPRPLGAGVVATPIFPPKRALKIEMGK